MSGANVVAPPHGLVEDACAPTVNYQGFLGLEAGRLRGASQLLINDNPET